jgi:hypothetical protein
VRVCNVVLTGNWPDQLSPSDLAHPFATVEGLPDSASRRKLIGVRHSPNTVGAAVRALARRHRVG